MTTKRQEIIKELEILKQHLIDIGDVDSNPNTIEVLNDAIDELMENKNIGKPKYGILENNTFGTRIVSGIVTGVSYTEEKPVYELSFGKNKWKTSEITDNIEDVFKTLKLAKLDRVKETHGLKIKYNS